MFQAYPNGFALDFNNGIQISVIFGYGNYCSNRTKTEIIGRSNTNSETAEILVTNDSFEIFSEVNKGSGNTGWLTTKQVGTIIGYLTKIPNGDWSTEKRRSIRETLRAMTRIEPTPAPKPPAPKQFSVSTSTNQPDGSVKYDIKPTSHEEAVCILQQNGWTEEQAIADLLLCPDQWILVNNCTQIS